MQMPGVWLQGMRSSGANSNVHEVDSELKRRDRDTYMGWTDDYDCCPLCMDDDNQEINLLSTVNNDATLKAWDFFVAITANSHFGHDLKCNIKMLSHSIQKEDEKEQEESDVPAWCRNLYLTELMLTSTPSERV
jgi:hypothetical protein